MPGAVFLHVSRVNGLLFLVLSHPLPPSHLLPAPPPLPPQASSYVMVDWESLLGGLWTGSWFPFPLLPPQSFLLLLLVTGFLFLGFFFHPLPLLFFCCCFSGAGVLISNWSLRRPCPPLRPPSAVWGFPAFPWCSSASCDLTRSDLQAILPYKPPPPHPRSSERSVLITPPHPLPFCFPYW